MNNNLKSKTVKGISWTLVEKFGLQGVKFFMGIILARLLMPEDFGLLGIITVFFAIANVMVYSGMGAAYIQKKEVTDIDANTVFFTNLSISIILYSVLWITAPFISEFYNEPELIKLIRIMGVIIMINAFNLIQISQVTRNLDFKRKAKITILSTLISGTIGIILAYYGFGVWSLVIQQLSNNFLITIGLWVTNKWSPTFQFSKESFKSMFSFGIWILFSNIIRTLFDNIYVLTIGKIFSISDLGFFSKSKQFKTLASDQIAGAIGVVSFPLFSKLQEDKIKLKEGMRKMLQHTLFVILPILTTLVVIAKPFVIILLTEKWTPMITFLQLFCILGFFYPIQNINNQLIYAIGKSKVIFRITLINNILRVINIFTMYRFGISYIILGEIIVSTIILFINFHLTNKFITYNIWEQLTEIAMIVLGTIISGFLSYYIIKQFNNLWLMFLLGIFSTVLLFLFFQMIFNNILLKDIISLKDLFLKKNSD